MTMGISVAGSILGVVFTNKAYSFVPIPDKSLLCLFPMIQIPMIYGKTFSSDEQKEIARLRRELRDAQDALDVSRSGYQEWLHHVPSDTEKRRKTVKAKIQDIYDASRQNYGAPKITVELRKTGEVISERTVGTYMRQMGIRAQ